MPELRDFQLLTSLSRHGHFARAARECGISQPAFSGRIRNLELELGVPLVKRGNRFLGFTDEGEIVLGWARRMLADAEGLRQEIDAAKGALTGRLAIGAVPTALAFVARVPAIMHRSHPGLLLEINSLTSSQIHQGLENCSLDAGVTYLDHELPAGLVSQPLYNERYVLLAPRALAPRLEGSATWAEVEKLPLCLLVPQMRNRRILDDVFARHVGRRPKPIMEANGFVAVLTQVATGAAATIAPEFLADTLTISPDAVRLPMSEPEVRTSIGLVMSDRDPKPPAVRALVEALVGLAR